MKPDRYKWDGDSRDERESEFSETGFSTTRGGAYHSTWASARARRNRKPRPNRIVWILLGAFLLSAALLLLAGLKLRG